MVLIRRALEADFPLGEPLSNKLNLKVFRLTRAAPSSLLIAGGLLAGCDNHTPANTEPDPSSTLADSLASQTGTLSLPWNVEEDGFSLTGGKDEFIRAGQTLKVSVPGWYAWAWLHPGLTIPDVATLQKCTVDAEVVFFDKTQELSRVKVSLTSWSGQGEPNQWVVDSSAFQVPANTDSIGVTMTFADPGAGVGPKVVGAAPNYLKTPHVFAGDLPNKSVLFDSDYGTMRVRMVESGNPVKGANLTVGYTDYRAETVADYVSIDRQIGEAHFYGRFGESIGPVYGQVVLQVFFGHRFDDGKDWQPEIALNATSESLFLPHSRTAYETTLAMPSNATQMDAYFHVRAVLKVDYTGYQMTNAWYQQGQEVVKREVWDNPSGSGTNFHFPLD